MSHESEAILENTMKVFKHTSLLSFSERRKTVAYLSRIDTKTESVKIQITQTQTFKNGLFQQTFV
jgi:hypothetical protein